MASAEYARYERSLADAFKALQAARVCLENGSNEGAAEDLVGIQLEIRRLMEDALRAQYPSSSRLRT